MYCDPRIFFNVIQREWTFNKSNDNWKELNGLSRLKLQINFVRFWNNSQTKLNYFIFIAWAMENYVMYCIGIWHEICILKINLDTVQRTYWREAKQNAGESLNRFLQWFCLMKHTCNQCKLIRSIIEIKKMERRVERERWWQAGRKKSIQDVEILINYLNKNGGENAKRSGFMCPQSGASKLIKSVDKFWW